MNLQSYQWIYRINLLFIATTMFLGAASLIHLFRPGNVHYSSPIPIKEAVWPAVVPDKFAFDAAVFKKTASVSDAIHRHSVSERFRLAGTFFAFGINQHSRKAILDDLQKKKQLLVTEGDLIGQVPGAVDNATRVQSIMSDRIILRTGTRDEEIRLCFAGGNFPGSQQAAYVGVAADGKLPSESRFGKMVGDKRWVLARSELMDYYKEVLNDTDRLAKIYDSLKPVYEGQNIAGYTLVIEGEGDMFTAFGLQPADIIRQVNSLPMTSQAKAEYFIGEFVKNRVNGFVLDIERAGRKEKLIYMIR